MERTADHIEYWYDKHTKLWVILVVDANGCEILDDWYEHQPHQYNKFEKDLTINEWCERYNIKAIKV